MAAAAKTICLSLFRGLSQGQADLDANSHLGAKVRLHLQRPDFQGRGSKMQDRLRGGGSVSQWRKQRQRT